MKRIVYECDWCGEQKPAGYDEEYPEGWSEFTTDSTHDLLCKECHTDAKDVVREAVGRAIKSAKERRRDVRDLRKREESSG